MPSCIDFLPCRLAIEIDLHPVTGNSAEIQSGYIDRKSLYLIRIDGISEHSKLEGLGRHLLSIRNGFNSEQLLSRVWYCLWSPSEWKICQRAALLKGTVNDWSYNGSILRLIEQLEKFVFVSVKKGFGQ